jgi:primosomal protein N' (replication factor Y)
MTEERFLSVAVDAPLLTPLTYKSAEAFARGTPVIVPLGKRKAQAIVLGEGQNSSDFEIKSIENRDDTRPALSPVYTRWLEWIADYYVHPIGQVLGLAFPPLAKKTSNRVSKKAPVIKLAERTDPPKPTKEQDVVVKSIRQDIGFHTHLLFGVTGSGKTEVYLRLLEETIKRGERGLVLVPEISLTPQLIQRFAARFGEKIAVIHSHLTDRERTNQWWSIVEGQKQILIGARSALFCPIENLGLIIVDEEHEPSYKQDEKLRYNARDSAIVLAKMLNIPIVLGSATPSLETWQNALSNKYKLHTMLARVGDRQLPTVEVVDLRVAKEKKRENYREDLPHWLSERLHEEITATLVRGEQVALFLNRRGVAQTVLCPDCGHIYKCPNCAISLTLHGARHLVCHYCDYADSMKETCPSCKIGEPKSLGIGTEQIEADMAKLFPQARVARADRDEIHSRETLEEMITNMETGKIDILVGTQMIAKGLDFPKLTLVGLVLADVGFNLPDFRATERSFQLLTQVSGRAGRHVAHGGRVIIQTYNPEYPGITYAQTVNFPAFAEHELKERQSLNYPPIGRLAAMKIVGAKQNDAYETSERLAVRGEKLREQNPHYKDIQILGPSEAPLAKLRGKFRFHILFKSATPNVLSSFCRQLLGDGSWFPAGTKVQVDIDPINLL